MARIKIEGATAVYHCISRVVGGQMLLGQVLRLRVRHLTDGVILGSKDFVNEMFIRHRDRFGARRKDGARPIRGVPIPGISVMRDLRVNAIG